MNGHQRPIFTMSCRRLLLVFTVLLRKLDSIAVNEAVVEPRGSTTIIVPVESTFSVVDDVGDKENHQEEGFCSLYLARSGIPGAGLGVFTGVDFQEGATIAWAGVYGEQDDSWFQDILIPILDNYKTIPFRGQQRFLSWLGYVWPEEVDTFHHSYLDGVYPHIPGAHYATPEGLNGADLGLYYFYLSEKYHGEKIPINVFAPGIASLVNSHYEFVNVAMDSEESITLNAETADQEEDEMFDPLERAQTLSYSPLAPGSGFVALHDVEAGSELFIYYGDEWHDRYDEKIEHQDQSHTHKGIPDYEDLEHYWVEVDFDTLPSEQDKRNKEKIMNMKIASKSYKIDHVEKKRRLHVDETLRLAALTKDIKTNAQIVELDEVNTTTQTRAKRHHENTTRTMEDGDNIDSDDEDTEDDSPPFRRNIEWLRKNGSCLDNLKVDLSTIPGAGRGAFANRFLSKGSVIAPAPLLALKRQDLIMFEINEDSSRYQHKLNLNKVVGQELLLNYCYGHPESDLLLVPYSPVVNFINHHVNSSMINAEIRWPSDEIAQGLLQRTPQEWLEAHPLDVTDQSGEILMEFIALRDIQPGEEIFVSYGASWQETWAKYEESPQEDMPFRHEIGVPEGFFPSNWLNQLMEYKVEPIEHLQPGEIRQFMWKHNGQPVAKNTFVVGLPENFTTHIRHFAEERGILNLYEQLLAEKILDSDEWYVFDADQHEGDPEQWFALRYKSVDWDFNMHYVAAWNDNARKNVFRAFGSAGYDTVLDSIGRYFGLDSLTCFHTSFMGVSEADKSFMHTDIYATGEVGFNIIFPIVTVDGSKPELDIQSDNADVVVAVKYEHDRAILMSDWGYHRTSAVDYDEKGQIRVVLGMYCAQIDESNHQALKFIYNGEDPAPFIDQFELPIKEIHWHKNGEHRLPR